MNLSDKKSQAYIGIIIACILWSLSFVWYKQALAYLNVITLVFLRTAIATIFLLLFALLTGKMQKIRKEDVKFFLLLSFFQPFAYFLLEVNAIKQVSPTLASLMTSTIPLFMPISAYLFFREKVKSQVVKGILLSIIGVALVAFASKGLIIKGTIWGIVLLFLSVLAAVGYNLTMNKIIKKYNSFSVIAYQNLIGSLMLLPVFVVFEGSEFIHTPFHAEVIAPLFLLGILCSGVAYIFFANSVRQVGMTITTLFENMMPALTAIGAFVILGESLCVLKVGGIFITIIALMIGTHGTNPSKWFK